MERIEKLKQNPEDTTPPEKFSEVHYAFIENFKKINELVDAVNDIRENIQTIEADVEIALNELKQTPKEPEINQCDGCRRGLPLKDGIHDGGKWDKIACTKAVYEKKEPECKHEWEEIVHEPNSPRKYKCVKCNHLGNFKEKPTKPDELAGRLDKFLWSKDFTSEEVAGEARKWAVEIVEEYFGECGSPKFLATRDELIRRLKDGKE